MYTVHTGTSFSFGCGMFFFLLLLCPSVYPLHRRTSSSPIFHCASSMFSVDALLRSISNVCCYFLLEAAFQLSVAQMFHWIWHQFPFHSIFLQSMMFYFCIRSRSNFNSVRFLSVLMNCRRFTVYAAMANDSITRSPLGFHCIRDDGDRSAAKKKTHTNKRISIHFVACCMQQSKSNFNHFVDIAPNINGI